MTAALYHLGPGSLATAAAGDVVVLDGAEGHHAATVKRARPGEEILLGDGSGLVATARVLDAGSGEVRAEVVTIEDRRRTGPAFVLVQALAKGGRDEQAVEAATELGVDGVLAWQADRSIVRWKGERGAKSLAKWTSVALAAAKQSRRPTVPDVDGPVSTTELAGRVREAALALVLHEDADLPLAGHDLPGSGEVLVVVGPEGGIAADELQILRAAGAVLVRLGPTVLRTSSAGPAALSVLNAVARWR